MVIGMMIGAVSFQPYVYTVNGISSASMNRLSRISDDVLDKKIDYSELVGAQNENPLKKGETLDFQGMLEMQMQRGRNNASRIMKPAEEDAQEAVQTEEVMTQTGNTAQEQGVAALAEESPVESLQAAATNMGNGDIMGSDVSNFRMQQAINAYEMFMTA